MNLFILTQEHRMSLKLPFNLCLLHFNPCQMLEISTLQYLQCTGVLKSGVCGTVKAYVHSAMKPYWQRHYKKSLGEIMNRKIK